MLVEATNGVMLASWSYFGIEDQRGVRVVLGVAITIAATMLSLAIAAPLIARYGKGAASAFSAEAANFRWIVATALLWYFAFSFAARFVLPQPYTPFLKMASLTGSAAAVVGAAALAGRAKRPIGAL